MLTEPIPDRLADLGWTGGEGLADARFTLHYLRTTPDGRIAIGGGGGRAGFGGRIGAAFTDDARSAALAAARPAAAVPVACATSGSRTRGAARSTSPPTTCPWFGRVPATGRSTVGHGYSGNGVAPSLVGGRILAALALERRDDPALGLPLADGSPPRAFPPEPVALPRRAGRSARRWSAARAPRSAATRASGFVERELSRLPRRLGYHLGPGVGRRSAVRAVERDRSEPFTMQPFPQASSRRYPRSSCRSPREQSPAGQACRSSDEPFKHVIDEYKHQAQTITCTCGWHGSSATIDRGGSEWTAHLLEVRGKKR